MGKLHERFPWSKPEVKEKIRSTNAVQDALAAGGYDDLGEAAYLTIRELYGTLQKGDFATLSGMGRWLSLHYDLLRDVVREELVKKGTVSCDDFWSDNEITAKIKATGAFRALVKAGGYDCGILRASAPVIEALYGKVEKRHFDSISDYLDFLWKHQRFIDELLATTLKDRQFMRKWESS